MALVKTVEMRILAKAGDAQAQLDELAAKADKLDGNDIKMRFRMDDAKGKAELDAIEARAKKLGFDDVRIKVRVDGKGRAIADLEAIKHEADKAGGGGLLGKLGGLLAGAGGGIVSAAGNLPFVGGLAGAGNGAGLAVVAAGAAALATELAGVASGFAAAGVGAGAFYLLAHPAISNLEQDVKQLNTAQERLQLAQNLFAVDPTKAHAKAVQAAQDNLKAVQLGMGQDAGGAAAGIVKLRTEYQKLTDAFKPQVFKVFNDGLKIMNSLLPHAVPFASTFASALDKLLQQAGKFTASKGFSDWLKQFHSLEGPAIQSIGQGIGNVANAFGKLLTVMSGRDVAHAINIAFGAIAGTINVVAASIFGFMQVFDKMKSGATSAVHGTVAAFKSMASGVSSAVSTVIGAWQSMVSGIEHGVSAAIAAVSSLPGKIRGLFAGAAGWLVGAGKAVIQGLINGVESMLGPLESLAGKVAGVVKSIAGFLGIHSPSTVMHGYGVSIVQGLIHGMHSQLPALEAAAKKAAAIIAARIKTETAYAKSVAQSALAGLNLTSIDLTQGTVATGMQSYLASIKAFIAEIRQLTSQHLSKGVLQQLIAAGPVTGGQYAQSILQAPGGVAQVNALYKQIQQQSALLGAQAAMSLYGGKVTPKGDTFNITVQGGLITDKQALALEIVKILRQYKRHGGNVPLGIA